VAVTAYRITLWKLEDVGLLGHPQRHTDGSSSVIRGLRLRRLLRYRRLTIGKFSIGASVSLLDNDTAYSSPAFSDQTIACLQCFPVES